MKYKNAQVFSPSPDYKDFVRNMPPVHLSLTAGETVDRVLVNWVADSHESDATIEFALKQNFNGYKYAHNAEVLCRQIEFSETYTGYSYTAELSGLQPDSEYYYRIKYGNYVGQQHSFHTGSAQNDEFSFLWMTDPQSYTPEGYKTFRRVYDEGLKILPEPSFVMVTGDFVERGYSESQWKYMFDSIKSYTDSSIFIPVIGNHDEDKFSNINFKNRFNTPDNSPNSALDGTSYYYRWNGTLFIAINCLEQIQEQCDWVRKVVFENPSDWVILVMHYSPYTVSYNSKEIYELIPALCDELNIALVLSGHDHIYMRATIKKGVKDSNGTTYISGGSSSDNFYSYPNRHLLTDFYSELKGGHVFSIITVNSESIRINAYQRDILTDDFYTLDDFIIEK